MALDRRRGFLNIPVRDWSRPSKTWMCTCSQQHPATLRKQCAQTYLGRPPCLSYATRPGSPHLRMAEL